MQGSSGLRCSSVGAVETELLLGWLLSVPASRLVLCLSVAGRKKGMRQG